MSDSEQMGRCRQQLEAWYANNSSSVPRYSWMVADAIDRLAEDVAAIKAKADAISPEDVAHFVESEKAWVALVTEQRDAVISGCKEARALLELAQVQRAEAYADRDEARAEVYRLKCGRTETSKERDEAIRQRDEARAEVERMKNELHDREQEILSLRADTVERYQPPAAPQPAAVSDAHEANAPATAPHSSRRSTTAEETSLEELQVLVHAWADERKILSGSSPQAQLVKLTEEVGELAAGVCRNDQQKIIDSIGDTAVVLIVMCGILRVSFRRCLQAAYDEIKGRIGTIEGGVFVKTRQTGGNCPETLDSSPASPQPAAPPPGWLTEEERETIDAMAAVANCEVHKSDEPQWWRRHHGRLEAILARSVSPPVVEVPAMGLAEMSLMEARIARAHRDAMDKAGVPWKEVGRE